jgi:thioester reductase-like protein
VQTVSEVDLLRSLELAMTQSGQFANGLGTTKALSDPRVAPPWTPDARYSLWGKMISSEDQSNTTNLRGELKELIEMIQRDPQVLDDLTTENRILKTIAREIGSHLVDTRCMDDDELYNVVIESLLMIEIKSWSRRHLGLELSLADISNAATIGGLGKVVISALRVMYQTSDTEEKISKTSEREITDSHLGDLLLGHDLHPISEPVPKWHSESEGHVLLTGATGFLGAFMLSLLSDMPHINTITCLVRASDSITAMNRLDAALEKFCLSLNFRDKVQAVPGDLSQEYLGLGVTEYENLAGKCSTIFHLGAVVKWASSYDAHREANVLGLVRVLGFANTRRLKSVHYFSSIAAYGPLGYMAGQEHIPESQIPVTSSEKVRTYTGYPLSKYVAETICWDAISNGFPLTIYRPGFVLGHSVTGIGNQDGSVNRAMSTCIRVGAYPHPPKQRNHFVPVDFVCASALHIALSNDNIVNAYNLMHPDPDQNISLSRTFDMIGKVSSSELRSVSISQWLELILDTNIVSSITSMVPIITDRLSEGLVWWDNEKADMTAYGTENLRKALADRPDLLQCKEMSDLLEVYFKQWSR